MKAILKPFFALCGLVALSTALSADSRLFPVGGGGAGWGEPGFLYSDYLQTAAASGREVEFQGSFVLDNRRPFLAELGTAFPGRVVDEVKSLPLREWGLGYVFEKRRPAHQRALLERGWRLADWLAEETLMAATESSRGGGLIRTLEFDLQSELGGRRAQVGLNVLGALRESNDEAIAWQFRGFKSSGGLGGNTGLIWRRAVANDRALAGANVFLDYETYADENFWRGSAGAELRSAWADVFGNVYRGFSDDVKKNNRTTYTADGYDVELNVHSPELPWLVGEVAYYNFEGKAGDKDDDGVRFGLRFNPLTDLELGVEYDNGDSDDDGKKKWAARIRYSGEFGGVLKAQYRPSTNSGNFEPRDWFFAPVEREYSQRIRKSKGGNSLNPQLAEFTENVLPIRLASDSASVTLVITEASTNSFPEVQVLGTVNGAVVSLTRAIPPPWTIPSESTLRLTHSSGAGQYVVIYYPRTGTRVTTRSTVEIATETRDFFRLVNGGAEIVVSSGMFFAEQYINDDNVRPFTVSVSTSPNLTLQLTVDNPITEANPTPNINPLTHLPHPTLFSDGVMVGTAMIGGNPVPPRVLNNLRANIQLATDPLFRTGTTPPIYYKAKTANGPFVVATLEGTGGGGDYTWAEEGSGQLEITSGSVVVITSNTPVTEDGVQLSLRAVLNDNASDDVGRGTPPVTVDFILTYEEIADLSASFNPAVRNIYGLTGEGQEITVATITSKGGPDAFTYAKTGGQLNVRPADSEGRMGIVVIPASIVPSDAPGADLVLEAELSQPIPGGSTTRTIAFTLTVKYIGVSRISPPAFVAATDKAILEQSATSYQVTALSTDDSVMNIATLAEVSEGGVGGFTYTKITGELGFSGRVVSIPSGVSPNGQRLSVAVRITDSGTGADATPDVTVMLTVQYVSVNEINLDFNDGDVNPNDGLVTVFGLEDDESGQNNVARVVFGGGFGGVTVVKTGGDLVLEGNTTGARINIPADSTITPQPAPNGRELLLTVSANEPPANDPRGITDAKTATMTVRYVQVNQLNGAYYPVDSNGNGQVQSGAATINGIHTVGMAQQSATRFTVASLSVSGGVGNYSYSRVRGDNALVLDSTVPGQILMRENINPVAPETERNFEIVIAVNDRGTNDNLTPAFMLTLTVSYNTIVPIVARIMDTRTGATPATIPHTGGRVYFLDGGTNTGATFGRLVVSGGFPSSPGNYTITDSLASGITYNDTSGELSMTKCTGGAKSIRFVINDVGAANAALTEPLTVNFAVTSGAAECLEHVSADVEDLSGGAVSQTLLRYGLEAVNAPSNVAVATIDVSGGTGDLSSTKTGELNLGGDSNRLLTVEIPAGTTPKAVGSANDLVLVAVLNDADANGGFLTNPATVSVTANYVAVPSVVLNLNRSGNPIDSVVDVYGKEGVAKTEKIADIMTGGGADGANVAATLRTDGTNPTTPNAFAISGNDLNLSRTFPAFADNNAGAQNVIAVVSANDSGGTQAHTDATPAVEKSATVRLLPVLAAVEEGGNIVEIGNADNVVAPTSPSATEANFTVYVLAGDNKHTPPIAQVSAAAVTRNAGVAGASALRIKTPTRHADSTPEASGLTLNGGNPVAQVRIAPGATATSGGADLKLVLEYDDEGFAPVHTLTESRRKTVNVHYETVAPFIVQARTADDSAVLQANAAVTAYVAAGATEEVRVARLNQVGGADGMDIVSQSGDLMAKKIGDVFYAVVTANTGIGDTLHLTVMMDDAPGAADNSPERAQGSQTQPVRLELTVAYLETQDVVASFANIPGDDHFLGAADSTSGVRTLYFKDSASRPAELDILRINIQSGSPPYTTDTSGTGFGLDGFNLKDGSNANNRVLALLQAKADGAMAVATVEIDDSGAAAAISDPITLTASVAVKHVEAIEVELIVPEDVPGGPTAGDTLGALYVRSAAAANSSSVHIANASASKGVEQFTYTRHSDSSAELLLNDSGEVHLAANYVPDGNKTLSIIIAANDGDSVDGSTLTEAAMITLEFVLAETIGAEVFLRNNGGAYVPNGTSGNDVAWGSGMRTVKVKTADYPNEQLVVGVRGSGGLGNSPAYSIARATGGNENGLVTRTPSPDGYGLGVAVKDGADAASAPQTFGITAIVNESATDPNNLTPGATISVTVVYDKVDDIAAAFEDTDGDPIPGRHVVARSEGVSNTDLMVASLNVSGGVGKDTGGDYTFTQDTPGDLIVNADGKVLVKGGVVPAIGLNLSATVKINDTGNWAHVSDELEVEITVLYSSKVVLDATIVDTRDDAVPANIPRTGGSVYFLNADPDENAVFARVDFSGALPGDDTYVVTASDEVGLAYDTTNRELSMTKCTGNATKSIKLTANDSPDTAGVSDPLVVEIEVTSGAAQCFDEISARPERLNAVRGAEITDIPKFYRLAGDDLDADLPVATVHVAGGAPAYVSDKTGGVLNLVKGSQGELTVVIPSGRTPEASPNNLEIVLTVNDDSNKGGFLTDVVEVKMTVDFAEVQPHGNLQGVLADGVTGSLEDGLLTVRRVAASSTPLRIVTNIRPAIPTEERIATEGSFTNFQIVFNTTTNQQDLQLIANQVPDGEVRMITVKVENHKNLASADDEAQFAARPDRLFTIAVRYLGELEAAAYDSETETAIAGDVNRYVESDEGAVAVATVSVSGGNSPYSYNLVAGGLELGTDLTNMTVLIPASAVPSAGAGLKLTARIEIDDNNRADTTPLNVDLTANYILIAGHSELVATPAGGSSGDLDETATYPLIRGAQSSTPVAALTDVDFKTAAGGDEALSKVDGDLLFDATAKEVQVAGGVEPSGQVLTVKLRATDGDASAQAKARKDRDYAVKVRYLKALSAKAYDRETSGGTEINAVQQIRVTESEATNAHFVARIDVEGGAGGNVIAVEGDVFEIASGELRIKADATPGDLATGNTLIATVKVNDDADAVGGANTDEVAITVTANYITLPPVAGGFVEGRDGNTAVPTSSPVIVYSAWTGPGVDAPATVAATATAVVNGRSGDTFTFHKIGTEGPLEVDENTGAITVVARRPAGGSVDNSVITVEFRAAADAVATQQILTVRHQMIKAIFSSNNGMQSRTQCTPGIPQVDARNNGTLITVILPTREEGTRYSYPSQCGYFAFGKNIRVGIDQPGYSFRIVRSQKVANGLEVYDNRGGGGLQAEHAVRLVGGFNPSNPPTFTGDRLTLSIVIAYNDAGPGGHVVDEFLRTVYVVFPGAPKLEVALENTSGAEITKPLTVYVAAAGDNVVASLNVSGGTGGESGGGYEYTGRALESTGALAINNAGKISVPSTVEPAEFPGTTFKYEVAVNDTGGDAARRGATPERKVILTLQYIKTSGPLAAAAVLATPLFADNTIFYGAAGVALTAAINVAEIAPSGGIPNPSYNYEIVGNSNLGISGTSGNNIQVQLKIGDTPGAGAQAERAITVKVTDAGDPDNAVAPGEEMVTVRVSFVEVAAHANLRIEDADTNLLSPNIVVVRPASETGIVEVAELVKVDGEADTALTQTETDGLTFDESLFDLEIDANQNPPTGQTLSIVLTGSDGNGENTDTAAVKAQKAARQDRLYTISVRYVPAITARVEDSSKNEIAAVVELTVATGENPVVGSVSVSGGVSDTYTYTPTAQNGSENLEVDADGTIKIPTGVTPLPGDGRTITVAIAVNDLNTAADNAETPAAEVRITVKYVLLEDLALIAKDLDGNDVGTGATDIVGTFYRLQGTTTDAPVLVATVTASGGIKLTGGAGDYTYDLKGSGGGLNFNTGTRQVFIPNNITAATPDTADATLAVTVEATDKRGEKKELTVQAVFETVQPLADLTYTPETGITANAQGEYVVVQAGAPGGNVRVLNLGSDNTLTKTGGDAALVFVGGSPDDRLEIVGSTPRNGQTIRAEITQSDGGDETDLTDETGARPDRIHNVLVRYIPALAAEARNAEGDAVLNAPIVITSKATTHIIASISVSGGTSDTYDYAIESIHTGGNDLIVSNEGIVSIPAGVQPIVGGLALTVRITANDKADSKDDGATDPASALVTVMYHLLESPEIEAQNLAGTELDNTNTPTFYRLAGDDLDSDLPVAKVVGSKGSGTYTYAIKDADTNGVANGMRVDTASNEGNIVIVSGETAGAGAAANRVITVELTDNQPTPEKDEVVITVRFEAVNPHGDLTFIAETDVTQSGSEYIVVQAGTPSAAVPVLNFASVDSVSRTAGDAPLVFVSGSPNRLEIAANTVPTGQTITAEITQTDGDNNDLERTRPDRTYTVSVRYIPALAAAVMNAAGDTPLAGVLEIEAETPASLNIASIAVSGGTSDTYDYSIRQLHSGGNALGVTDDGVVYIPVDVAPLPTEGLSLTAEITANDKADSKNANATPAALATITVKYVMDPGVQAEAQDLAGTAINPASPPAFYRLLNDPIPDTPITGMPVAKVVASGGTPPYRYVVFGNTNPDGLGVDQTSGEVAIQTGQTGDDPAENKVRKVTVRITDNRQPNARETLATISVIFEAVGRFGNLLSDTPENDAYKNPAGHYVLVRPGAVSQALVVIDSFGIGRADTVTKFGGSNQLVLDPNAGAFRLRIAPNTVPGGVGGAPGGLTLIADLQANDDDSTPQKRARPNKSGYLVTVIYLAEIDATVEDASDTEIPDLANIDITGPANEGSVYVGDIAASGGTGDYSYTKLASGGGELSVDDNGQVFIPASAEPTADDGTQLFIVVDVDDKGDNNDRTAAKRISLDVDYILDPGLSGQVQNLDGTPATSTPTIYRLAGDTVPDEGLATGLKVVGQRGTGYTYAIEGTSPNPDGLSVDTSSGVISIVASQTPDTDASKVRVVTVKISGTRNGNPSEALVTVSVIFRAVEEIASDGAGNFQIQSNNRCGIPRIGGSTFQRNVLPLAEEGTEYSHTNACQFFTLIDESRTTGFGFKGGSGGFDKAVVGTPNGLSVDQRGTDLRIQLSSQPVLYTAERLTLDIVIAYNDNGPAKDLTAEHRKTIEIVLPGVPSVDAVLNDEGGNAIADIAAIEKRGPGNLSVFVGNIVASGGDGNLAIVKDATDGGDLGIDNNGQVYIPDSVQPAAGAGNQLHLLVNINDDGANSGLTKQKQLRIEVDYILQLGLAGQTQDLEDNNVSGEHVVYRQAGVAVPTEGLTVVKVVGERGTSPYTYAVEGDASGSKLILHTASGSVAIAANETASDQLLELTVRISDNASPAATALHTVSVRFNSVAPHADLTRELAAGVTQNSAGEYVVAQDGAQTQSFQVLTKIKSDEGAAVNRIGTDPIELQYVFNTFSDEGNLKIGGNTAPTGQTLSFQVVATDGNGEDDDSAEVKAQKTARQDRTFDIAVRYLSHLQTPTLQDRNDADIDLSSAVLVTAAGGASVYVGDIAASGGTGEYTFGKDATTGGLTVSPAGQVYLRSDAVPTSEGAAFAITVNVNDSGKDNEVTNGTAIEITVNYILQETGPALPLLEGDLVVYQELGTGFERRICPGDACQLPLGTPPPTIIPTDPRMTVWGLNSDTARQFIFNAGFSVPVVITDGSGSDFEVGEAVSTPTGTRYRVYLKQENIKRWGQELQARLVVRDSANTREQLVTVKVLLSERLPDSALTVGIRGASNHGTTPGSRTNTNASRPMQFNLPAGYDPDTDTKYPTAPAFQTIADFPGITVQGLVVNNFKGLSYRGVRATATVDPILALGISRYGDFFWDEDTKDLKRRGVPIPGGNPRYYVELMDPGANPKIIPAIVNFRATSRPLAPLAWQTSPPSTISPSGNTSFEVKAGAQARNYSPYRDMVAEVNAPFVISNMRTTRAGGNDWRFHFDVSLQSGASAGAHTANIVVRDRGYTSFEPLTHTATATK